jgi:iron complex transport system substrate-binding protein
VYGTVPGPSPSVALEDLVRRDPDVILTGAEGRDVITHNAAWRAVRAVREGRIVVLDTGLVGRPSVRLGEAAVSLARTLHPGALR